MNPPITGLTLHYRDSYRTRRCIDSLLRDGVENVLVWDNSADDGKSTTKLQSAFSSEPRVTIIVSPENIGFATGVNRGIEWIRQHMPCNWVFLINNDALLIPGQLKVLHSALKAQTKKAIAYPDIDHNGIIHGTAYYQPHFGLITFNRPLPGSFPYPSGCALLIAMERLNLPLFDEHFFMYGEDCLLGWKYRDTGTLMHIPKICVWHEGSASSGMTSEFYETHLVTAHVLLARKMAQGRVDLILLLLGRAFSLSIRALLRAKRYRNWTPIRVFFRGWKIGLDRTQI